MFASLTVGGEMKRFYRFQTPDDSIVDYYDETGKSAKKFLVRKPLATGIMRSGFGFRRHPILGYTKMHTGVDWSAPRARRSTPPATARSTRSAGNRVTANISASATPTATRPPMAT